HFTVRESQRALLQLPAGENVIERRAEEALGREVRGHLHAFAGETRGLRAHGLAVSPEVEYGSARNVWLFVNGRAVRDRSLTHAVLRAYGELMPHGRYPGAIVFVEVPPTEVDVNVHPAKAEVRLADPRAAWDAIYSGLAPLLSRSGWLPQKTYPMPDWGPPPRVAEQPTLYPQTQTQTQAQAPPLLPRAEYFQGLRYLGQLHRTYLVCEGPRGLVLIDQHAAHERVNYQRLRAAARQPVQPLLVPHTLKLPAAAAARLAGAVERLRALGIEIEPFGGDTAVVRALPRPLQKLDESALGALFDDLADELEQQGRQKSLQDLHDALAARAACHGSVRAHDALAPGEAQALLDALDQTDYGARCAHGRPVVAEFDTAEIERRFGRDYQAHSHAAPPETL
ncbi:MAG: DNA mismatch repair endonuclease MutL, partial [Myxococcales bacterium]